MENKPEISKDYEMFGSIQDFDNEEAFRKLSEKETQENLELFAKRIGADWRATGSSDSSKIFSFSDFENAVAHKKEEIAEFLRNEREARKND